MRFIIEVGEVEKHLVEFSFNQLAGSLLIQVDNQPVLKTKRVFNEPVREVFQFMVGDAERLPVRIEKQRKPLFGHRNCVYVAERLTRVVEGF